MRALMSIHAQGVKHGEITESHTIRIGRRPMIISFGSALPHHCQQDPHIHFDGHRPHCPCPELCCMGYRLAIWRPSMYSRGTQLLPLTVLAGTISILGVPHSIEKITDFGALIRLIPQNIPHERLLRTIWRALVDYMMLWFPSFSPLLGIILISALPSIFLHGPFVR